MICDSNLERWKKLAIRIISNNVKQCKEILEKEIENDKASYQSRYDYVKEYGSSSNRAVNDFCEMLDFNKFI